MTIDPLKAAFCLRRMAIFSFPIPFSQFKGSRFLYLMHVCSYRSFHLNMSYAHARVLFYIVLSVNIHPSVYRIVDMSFILYVEQ